MGRSLVLSLGLLAVPAAAQLPTWAQVPCTVAPAPRQDHSTAYDAARSRLVLFGGRGQAPYLYFDTWEFDGAVWRQRSPPSAPPGRWGQALAYLPAGAHAVLFGGTVGHLGQSLQDTWTWDGSSWTQRAPAASPPRRLAHAMATDWVQNRVILFGGRTDVVVYGDTWAWDGAGWTMLPGAGPPPRCCHDMAQDVGRGRIVLFGGWDQSNLGDTWEFDGAAWQQVTPSAAPTARAGHRMAFDPLSGRMILHGGDTGRDETWQWDGAAWTLLCTTPAARAAYHGLDFDLGTGRFTMSGGGSGADGTWTFGVTVPATLTAFGAGCPGSAGTPVLQAQGGGLPWIGRSFTFTLAPLWSLPLYTHAFLVFGWSDTTSGGVGLPYSLAPLGAPGCDVLVSNDAVASVAAVQTASFVVPLPYAPSLVGVRFFNQGAVLDSFANPLGLSVSNGTVATIGWM